MFNLKNLFKRQPHVIPVNKEETALLEYLITNKDDFNRWFVTHASTYPKIKIQFFYPAALDLVYDEFRLFTAYFKNSNGPLTLIEFKCSAVNSQHLKSADWAPFKEVFFDYLAMVEKRNTDDLFRKHKALYEYQQLCKDNSVKQTTAPAPLLQNPFAIQ